MIALKQWPARSFAPDLDPLSPGVLVASNNLYPTLKGVATLPELVAMAPALDTSPAPAGVGTPTTAFVAVSSLGEQVLVVGTTDGLLYLSRLGTWVFQQTFPAVLPWSFTTYKNPLDAHSADKIIAAGSPGSPYAATFHDIIGLTPTPWASLIFQPHDAGLVAASDVSLFLVEALATRLSATWWSTVNETLWVPAIETETVTGQLTTTPGSIIAIAPLRGGMVFYKLNSTYFASFSGPPFFWTFQVASHQVGCVGVGARVLVRDVDYFCGPDDFYTFDGFAVNPIPNPLKEWFFGTSADPDQIGQMQARFDENTSCIFWHYVSAGHTTLDSWLCLNIRTQQWMAGTLAIDCVVQGMFPAGGPSAYLNPHHTLPGIIDAQHQLSVYSGPTTGGSSLTTGDIGDRHFLWNVNRIRPAWTMRPTSAAVTMLKAYTPGGPYVAGPTVPMDGNGWFNLVSTDRLQRVQLTMTGPAELVSLELAVQPAGVQ